MFRLQYKLPTQHHFPGMEVLRQVGHHQSVHVKDPQLLRMMDPPYQEFHPKILQKIIHQPLKVMEEHNPLNIPIRDPLYLTIRILRQ